jgi:hypothetical protein
MASSSSSASSKPPADDKTLDDLDRLLNREASAFQREREAERILGAFKLNPYDVLDLELGANADGIKRKYRHLSLCESLCTISLPPLVLFFAESSPWVWRSPDGMFSLRSSPRLPYSSV